MTAHERSPYEMLRGMDLVAPVANAINQRIMELGHDGRIRVESWRHADRCWLLFHPRDDRDCIRWNEIYHRYYGIVPKGCRHCWKVVHKVPNLAQLFRLAEIMQGMGLEAKCGVDSRPEYGNLHGCTGFWYTPLHGGLKAGRALYKQVKEHLTAEYGTDQFHLILKRGCTEMEAGLQSDQWDKHAEAFDETEAALDALFDVERPPRNELDVMRPRVHASWIRRRALAGDESAEIFGIHVAKTMQYQDSKHSELDFPGLGRVPFCKGVDDE